MNNKKYLIPFQDLSLKDLALVGGKNASLGEMISSLSSKSINVPIGFATSSFAYWDFIDSNNLRPKIAENIDAYKNLKQSLQETGANIRSYIYESEFSDELSRTIVNAYADLGKGEGISVAVRSSATAEDLPDASFAGQLESFLNISGKNELLEACKKCFASLFTDRAISYREAKGFDQQSIALSVGVQKMVRSDLAGSGVMFSIDTETGFKDSIVINAAWGLGEQVVQGAVSPDEYMVFKPLVGKAEYKPILSKKLGTKESKMVYASGGSKTTLISPCSDNERKSFVLSTEEILKLALWAKEIEAHYGRPMDIEWAKDGLDQELYIVQARPETVQSRKSSTKFFQYKLLDSKKPILEGLAIGNGIAEAKVQMIESSNQIEIFNEGSILVTTQTDPDWVPIMKKASGIITDSGGRTSHAAIVSRELGLPVIVGAKNASSLLKEDQEITLSCIEGERGKVYQGFLEYEKEEIDLTKVPKITTEIMLNIADPDSAMYWWQLPCNGIGLARMEFIISNIIKVHPMALVDFDKLNDKLVRKKIEDLTYNHITKEDYFISELSRAIAKIAASQYPKPCIVRMSDFKSNEYAGLIGGKFFEKEEINPMLGFRGAVRYYSEEYKRAFALECKAIKKAREEIGLTNIIIMIPFCRTLEEADKVLEVLEVNGLKRGEKGLEVYVMAEIPSNIILAEEFAERFDGFSIGSNDLTQLTLGISRDSDELIESFDESNEAVKIFISDLISKAHSKNTKVGFCGQAPSDREGYAEFLVEQGIDSISLNPDSVIKVIKRIAVSFQSVPS